MNSIQIEQKEVLKYLSNILNSIRIRSKIVVNDKFHHNSSYIDAPKIIEYGILSLKEQNRFKIRNDSDEYLNLMKDTNSHINGDNAVSLSVVGLTDLYPNEFEYDPTSEKQVDFIVSNSIEAHRSTINYGNEYICYDSIGPELIRSIDIRILKFIELLKSTKTFAPDESMESLISKYNSLINMSVCLIKNNLDIPIREMSDTSVMEIDNEKLSCMPRLILKR